MIRAMNRVMNLTQLASLFLSLLAFHFPAEVHAGPQNTLGHSFLPFCTSALERNQVRTEGLEGLVNLARHNHLSDWQVVLVNQAIQSFSGQSLSLPRVYPSEYFHYPEDSSASSTARLDVFDLIELEAKNFQMDWWKDPQGTLDLLPWDRLRLRKVRNSYGINVLEFGKDPTTILRVENGGDYTGALRKTLSASILNEELGIHTVPRARSVWLRRNFILAKSSELAVQSEFSPGAFGLDLFKIDPAPRLKSESEAFEFLVGNADVFERNITVEGPVGRQTNIFVFEALLRK